MNTCGLDEAGRGPLAGPLVAAGVILDERFCEERKVLKDSKKLSKNQRELIYQLITKSGCMVMVKTISVKQINAKGIGWANKEVFRRLIKKIQADKFVVDGNLKLGRVAGKTSTISCVVKADNSEANVMAASIVAKVTRDMLMTKLHQSYPWYGWNKNKGYGTKSHIEAIKKHGAVEHHRTLYVTTALSRQGKN